MSTRTDYSDEMQSRLKVWRAELAQIELKAESLTPESRQLCYSEIKTLQEKRNRMVSLVEDLERASNEQELGKLESELRRAESDFEETLDACRKRLEHEP